MAEAVQARANRALWWGLLLTVLGPVCNGLYYVGFPAGAVVWLTLLLPIAGLVLVGMGVRRAFAQPEIYRGKIWGSVAAVLSVVVVAAAVGIFVVSRRLPAIATDTPRIGQRVPDFTLPDSAGHPVSLSELLTGTSGSAPPKAVLLIFYRGYW